MKIGVISDTHIPDAAVSLPSEIFRAFSDVDMILHAGDILEMAVIEELSELAEVRAVRGNMDHYSRAYGLPEAATIEVAGFHIGLTHGGGGPAGLARRVREQFDNVDCIVFGHSHRPSSEMLGDVLMFNPGSPTDRRFAPYRSYGILEVGDTITGRIIRID
jgi:putative phosphoesterase